MNIFVLSINYLDEKNIHVLKFKSQIPLCIGQCRISTINWQNFNTVLIDANSLKWMSCYISLFLFFSPRVACITLNSSLASRVKETFLHAFCSFGEHVEVYFSCSAYMSWKIYLTFGRFMNEKFLIPFLILI